MQKKRPLIIIVSLLVLAVAVFIWRSGPDETAGGPPGGMGGMPVEAQPVAVQTLERTIEAIGTIQSNESVMIRPEITGLVSEILFEEGQAVEAATPLIRLDASVYKAELADAQASLALSETNYKRAQELFQKQTGTERARDEARARLESDRARVALAQARLDKTELKAPFEGILGLRRVSAGDYVAPGQDIVNLEDIDPLKVDFRVAETYLPQIHEQQALHLSVDALPGKSFTGTVYAIDPRIDEEGRSIVIRARVPNTEKLLRPGLFTRVRLVVDSRENAVLVPEQAILPQQEQQFVYKVVDGKAVMAPVETGMRQHGMVEITKGLKAGDVVITAGQMKIGPDAPVTVMPPQGAGGPPQGDTPSAEPAAGQEEGAPE